MDVKGIKKLKDKVAYCLENYPKTRNSDVRLTAQVWATFHSNALMTVNGEYVVRIKDLFTLPREDTVKRVRAAFQNDENKWLPTDPSVREKRGISEQEWRKHLGYSTF